jgi:4-hydroxybutyrate CoA-transferase
MNNDYRSRITTADAALRILRSGERVYVHNGCAEPIELVQALTRRGPELRDVEVLHMATMGVADYSLPQYEGHFRTSALFIGGNVRKAVQEGRADYTPIFLSEIEGLFTSGALPIDVCLLQCAPPDNYGYMSLGVAIDASLTAAQCARHVIVEINDRMPRTHGDTFLHVSRVDAFIETSHPLAEYPKNEISEVHRGIARQVAPLIPDGATIQTGIGGIPEAALGLLRDHKDLGIHSEMIPDSAVELIRAGVINGERKTLHPRKCVAGFVLGIKLLFDFIDDNPTFEFHRTAYANDPFVIAQNDRMVSLNSAIEVDLTGQVCADSIGQTLYSGIGGQVDFLRGAARSKGGKPIVTLPATAKNGTISRIVPRLQPGAGVVTSRGDVHYVITEYGVAYLHGKTLRQRAEALIQVAAPQFRGELERHAIEAKILRADKARAAVLT